MSLYQRTKPTDWNRYHNNRPTNIFVKYLFLNVMLRAYKKLLAQVTIPNKPNIIELGSGTGYITKELAIYLNASSVVLVDFNDGMLDISRKIFEKTKINAKFIKQDLLALNTNEKFDLVHSAGVLEHFEKQDQRKILQLHANLLTPKGYCVIYVPTPTLSYRIIRFVAEKLGLWKYTDEIPLTYRELHKITQDAGLEILSTNYFWRGYYLSEIGIIAQKK